MAAVWCSLTPLNRSGSNTGKTTTCPPCFHYRHIMIFYNPRTSISKRVSIVLHPKLFTRLQERCDFEGRSLSNLCAYLLERSLDPEE